MNLKHRQLSTLPCNPEYFIPPEQTRISALYERDSIQTINKLQLKFRASRQLSYRQKLNSDCIRKSSYLAVQENELDLDQSEDHPRCRRYSL